MGSFGEGGGAYQPFQIEVAVSCRGNINLDEMNLTIHTLHQEEAKKCSYLAVWCPSMYPNEFPQSLTHTSLPKVSGKGNT